MKNAAKRHRQNKYRRKEGDEEKKDDVIIDK